MFIVVTAKQKSRKRLFAKKFKLLQFNQRGATFLKLDLKKSNCIKDKKVLMLIGRSPVMFARSVEPLEDNQFNLIDDTAYSLKLLQNGVKLLLSEGRLQVSHKTAVLIDLKCKYQELADILLNHFGTLKIVTSRKDFYKNYVDAKLYECGAAVIIQENLDKLDRSSLYVSPSGILLSQINAYGIWVISMRPINLAKSSIIHSFRATTPAEYREIMPEDLDEHLYQAGIYSYCGKRGLSELYPTTMMVNGTVQEIDSWSKMQLDDVVPQR